MVKDTQVTTWLFASGRKVDTFSGGMEMISTESWILEIIEHGYYILPGDHEDSQLEGSKCLLPHLEVQDGNTGHQLKRSPSRGLDDLSRFEEHLSSRAKCQSVLYTEDS